MKSQKEKFLTLVDKEKADSVSKNRNRIKNRSRLRESQQIALKILTKLNKLSWSQRKLAKEMGVSPQQVTKIVRGKENLTLATQVKIQEVLDIPILATYYERKIEQIISSIVFEMSNEYFIPKNVPLQEEGILHSKLEMKMEYDLFAKNHETYSMSA